MKFSIDAKDSKSSARTGLMDFGGKTAPTPLFMPVGTAASVKAVHQRELRRDIDAPLILGNTYHLYLRPGLDIIRGAGGLHRFMNWDRLILTDSGGYQVYSLAESRKLTRDGARFQSHIDGSRHLFTPENVVDTQRVLGPDIMMAFDECTPYPCEYDYARDSMHLTHGWLDRCIAQFNKTGPLYGHNQVLFPIVQGSTFPDLRKQSAEYIASRDMPGNAIGGLSVGEPHEDMYAMTELVCSILPADKPRYLMGVGTPANILECIALGVDLFDCVMPSRNARNGMLFTWDGIINIRNEKWKADHSPIDPKGTSYVDSEYTKAYLRHLVIAGEILAAQIATIHNLAFYLDLVRTARRHILDGDFATWKAGIIRPLQARL
jgi:queuine tRNA-ribosyltransferase